MALLLFIYIIDFIVFYSYAIGNLFTGDDLLVAILIIIIMYHLSRAVWVYNLTTLFICGYIIIDFINPDDMPIQAILWYLFVFLGIRLVLFAIYWFNKPTVFYDTRSYDHSTWVSLPSPLEVEEVNNNEHRDPAPASFEKNSSSRKKPGNVINFNQYKKRKS